MTGSLLIQRAGDAVKETSQQVTPINKAKNVIFVLMTGAPLHGILSPAIRGIQTPTGVNQGVQKRTDFLALFDEKEICTLPDERS